MIPEYFKNKKVGILGYGLEGQGVAKYLASNGVSFFVFDKDLNTKVPYDGAKVFCGPDYLKEIQRVDVLFRSPGIKLSEPELITFKNSGAIVSSQIKYFFENCQAKIIGVTGTKGKGTTSKLIQDILIAAGKKTFLAGNIGTEVLSLLDQVTAKDFVVLELSSFQLQDMQLSPHIAVVLMVTSEHLDYHKDVEEYIQAKESITKFQSIDDFAVINFDYISSRKIGGLGLANKYFVQTLPHDQYLERGVLAAENDGIFFLNGVNKEKIGEVSDLQLRGYHNVQNVAAALCTAHVLGLDMNSAWNVAKNFKGLEHRLELVCEKGNIKFYNDSFGTTPETAIAAIKSFSEDAVVIVGGFNKGGDYKMLAKQLTAQKNIKAIILIGDIAPTLQKHLREFSFSNQILTGAKNMSEIFDQIHQVTKPGDVVLLAPGTSSFDMFKNYKDRGNQFKEHAFKYA